VSPKGETEIKILLIEDSRFLRAAIERSLAKAGHEVISIADGREALLVARSSLPALILLDLMLPGMEGTCVLKELKQNPSTSHIPIIVLTGLSQKNETKLRKAGAVAYIEKSSLDLGKVPDAIVHAVAGILDTLGVVQRPSVEFGGARDDTGADKAEDRVSCSGEKV
jgi:two-component system cell cycle response regulator DivK